MKTSLKSSLQAMLNISAAIELFLEKNQNDISWQFKYDFKPSLLVEHTMPYKTQEQLLEWSCIKVRIQLFLTFSWTQNLRLRDVLKPPRFMHETRSRSRISHVSKENLPSALSIFHTTLSVEPLRFSLDHRPRQFPHKFAVNFSGFKMKLAVRPLRFPHSTWPRTS